MIGIGMQHSIPLVNLFKEENEVNVVANKPTASEWLVDSRASMHATNCKEDLNEPEDTNQAVTIGSGKVMVEQFKGKWATLLVHMTGNTVELENTLLIPNFKKKIVSLSKLLDQGYSQGHQMDQDPPHHIHTIKTSSSKGSKINKCFI